MSAGRSDRDTVALVTGAAGFTGRHLVETLLRDTDWQIVGFGRTPSDLQHERYRFLIGDLRSENDVTRALAESLPAYVFHLAAVTPPAPDGLFHATNVGGTANLLEAVHATAPGARLLVVGSDAQFGLLPPRHIPTTERAPMRPVGAYGRSKALQEHVALQFRRMTGLAVVCVRPFNHIGPGQSDRFVVASLARQIALAEIGLGPASIQLGRTDASRDFTDARDVVRAYLACILDGQAGQVYNIGSGTPRRIIEIAQILAALAQVAVTFETVEGRVRPGDVVVTQCDATRLHRQTGWAPQISIEQTLLDTLEQWRADVRVRHCPGGMIVAPGSAQ